MSGAPRPASRLAFPPALLAYRAATTLLSPVAPVLLRRRARRGKEEHDRLGERLGHPARARPEGDLVWAHGASIGETQALIPLVEALVGRGLKVLVTSGTRTSAEILGKRLPPGARHHYVPVDAPAAVRRFLDHWRPCLAVFAESEIWPNIVVELARREVPLVLVNGHMSARSFAGWRRWPGLARALFGRFALCCPQTATDAERLAALGAPVGRVTGNLKFDIAPLPADPAAVEDLSARLAGRPLWMAASTHPGEEEMVLSAHPEIAAARPGLLTILAPRHPARADEVAETARRAGLQVGRRSRGEPPEAAGDVYVADTIGELGLFYRVVPLVVMGGSLASHGSQNPIEPVRLGAVVLHGPHHGNFAEVYAALDSGGASLETADADALTEAALDLLPQPGRLRDMARRGRAVVDGFGGALARILEAISPYLPPPRDPREALW